MAWTEERVKVLEKLWKERKTAGQIAEVLGDTTRNAVIGKVYRLGLARSSKKATAQARVGDKGSFPETAAPGAPGTAADASSGASQERSRGEAATESASGLVGAGPAEDASRPVEGVDEAMTMVKRAEREAKKLSLLELTERTCKWPVGDPATDDFWFCGLPSKAGKPYCEAHIGIAFQPFTSRRDNRSSISKS